MGGGWGGGGGEAYICQIRAIYPVYGPYIFHRRDNVCQKQKVESVGAHIRAIYIPHTGHIFPIYPIEGTSLPKENVEFVGGGRHSARD